MAIAHAGVEVPLLAGIGPGGGDAVVPAAVAFGIATIVLTAVAVGASRARAWAWAVGVAVHGLVLLGAAVPYRGVASLVAIIVSGAALALLLSRSGRAALLAR